MSSLKPRLGARARPCAPEADRIGLLGRPIPASASPRTSSASSSRPSSRPTAPPAASTAARASASRSAARSPGSSAARSSCREPARARAAPSRCSCRSTRQLDSGIARQRRHAGRPSTPPAAYSARQPSMPRWRCRRRADDRTCDPTPGDHIVLIVEDDPMFASVLLELARERGFRGLIAQDGAAALALAHRYKPHAITLDIGLPDMDGWALLDLLKNDPRTRHIPIHVISVNDEKKRGLRARCVRLSGEARRPRRTDAGARAVEGLHRAAGPQVAARRGRRDPDAEHRRRCSSDGEVTVFGRGHGEGGAGSAARPIISTARSSIWVCPICRGAELIEQIRAERGGDELADHRLHRQGADDGRGAAAQADRLHGHRQRIQAPRRDLLDETALFLHRTIAHADQPRPRSGPSARGALAARASRLAGR